MKRNKIAALLLLFLLCNTVFAQSDLKTTINKAEETADYYYNERDYKSASDYCSSAIMLIEKEMAKTNELDYLPNLLVLKHKRIWCCLNIAATETLTKQDAEYAKAMVYADSNYLLKYFDSGLNVLWGKFTREDVYLARGLAKYFLGVKDYHYDLDLAGQKGKEALRQIQLGNM